MKYISEIDGIRAKFEPQNVDARINEVVESLKNDYVHLKEREAAIGNTKTTIYLVIKIFILLGIYFFYTKCIVYMSSFSDSNLAFNYFEGLKVLTVIAAIYDIYGIIYSIICMTLDNSQKKIESINKVIHKSLDKFNKKDYGTEIVKAVSENREFTIKTSDNKIGKKIMGIRNRFEKTENLLNSLHEITAMIAGPALILTAIIYYYKCMGGLFTDVVTMDTVHGLNIFGLLLFVGAKNTLMIFSDKLGKVANIIGAVVGVLYGLLVFKMIGTYYDWTFSFLPTVRVSWIVVGVVTLGYVMGLAGSNYANEKEYLENTSAAHFGCNQRSDFMMRVTMMIPVTVLMLICYQEMTYNNYGNTEFEMMPFMSILMFFIFPIVKSSTLRQVWGSVAAVGITIAQLGSFFIYVLECQNVVGLYVMAGSFIIFIIAAAIQSRFTSTEAVIY